MRWWSFFWVQLAAALALLWLSGQGWLALLGAWCAAWLWWLWQAWQQARLLRWLRRDGLPAKSPAPPAEPPAPRLFGIWAELQYFWRKRQQQHQQRQAQLQANLQELRQAIQATPNGVMLLDAQWAIEWLDGQACAHFGLDAHKDLGQNLLTLVRDPEFASYCTVGDFRERLHMDGRSLDAHGLPVRSRLAVQIFPYGEGKRLLLSQDETHVQHNEAMRRDFIANVSHEIRTPLTIFAGYVETLQTLPLTPEQCMQYYGRMRQQTQRMQVLVEDLLTLSRLEGSPLPSLGEFIEVQTMLLRCRDEALGLSASLAALPAGAGAGAAAASAPSTATSTATSNAGGQPQHRITLHYADDSQGLQLEFAPGQQGPAWPEQPGRIAGADKEIHSAFSNLIANAVRYTPAGGRIDLRWRWLAEGSASFTVQDSGPGIAAEHLPRLTERFYRIDRSRSRETGGTGLGLAIVKHVVQRHGGQLHIQSTPGSGSQFTIELPATRLQTPAALAEQEQQRARRERLLAR
ncbi:ATP-binding protein [Vandammella animalimorsus]|nr:ATP-binding protein [Vandammella animalimorsus]